MIWLSSRGSRVGLGGSQCDTPVVRLTRLRILCVDHTQETAFPSRLFEVGVFSGQICLHTLLFLRIKVSQSWNRYCTTLVSLSQPLLDKSNTRENS